MPHRLTPRPSGLVAAALVAASAATAGLVGLVGGAGAAHAASAVDRQKGSDYLVGQLVSGAYDEAFPGSADIGLTIDTGLALAATGDDAAALAGVVRFVETGSDPSGMTVLSWTGIADWEHGVRPDYRSGGSIAKAVLLEQVVGHDPSSFAGSDLVTNLAQTICTKRITNVCAAPGGYRYTPSTFGQALGIIAQVRAGADATRPVTFLAGQQQADGSFPSQLPRTAGDEDVDSTAMAAMALDLVPGHGAAVDRALAWLAGQQLPDGGFPGAAGNSTNSAGLAIQGLTLRPSTYGAAVGRARAFLAAHQQPDGGFPVNATETTSDVRASTQALGGSTGTSFGTLRIAGSLPGGTTPPSSTPPPSTPPATPPASTPPASSPPTGTPPASAGTPPAARAGTSAPGAPRGGGIVDARSAATAPAPSASATSTAAASATTGPTPTSTSTSSPAGAAVATTPPTARDLAVRPASGPLAKVNPLWWVVLVIAVGFGVVLARTLRRRPAPARTTGPSTQGHR